MITHRDIMEKSDVSGALSLLYLSCRIPFYYELKIAFVVWLLSPYTKGSSVLYRKFVHPTLSSKEKVNIPPISLSHLPFPSFLPPSIKYKGVKGGSPWLNS